MNDDWMRRAVPDDHPGMVRAIQEWWGDSRDPQQARELSLLLPRLFLQHFSTTSLVVDDGAGAPAAFLVGFHSPDHPREAYIHFVGVAPSRRRDGLARALYARFFETARKEGRDRVRAVTSPQNAGSIAFHRALGFELEKGDDGESIVFENYDGPGQDRVSLVRNL